MPKTTSVAPKVTASKMIHLSKYPRMVQRYFIKDENGAPFEVFRVNSKNQAVEGAQQYDIITSSGNIHVFATEVKEVIKLSQADKNRTIAELKAKLEAGTIDHQAFSDAIIALI